MGKADGARTWARVLSELADVTVTVEWERPAWRVHWRDGPTREALMTRATALSTYRVGAPLPAEQLRFFRSNSVTAIALGWLANGACARSRCRSRPGAKTPATPNPGSTPAPWRPPIYWPDSAAATRRRWARCSAQAAPPVQPYASTSAGARADRPGDQLPLARRWPARRAARTTEPTPPPKSATHVPTLRQTSPARAARPPGEVLQRCVPSGGPPADCRPPESACMSAGSGCTQRRIAQW